MNDLIIKEQPALKKIAEVLQSSNNAVQISNAALGELIQYVKKLETKIEIIEENRQKDLAKVSINQRAVDGYDTQAALGRMFNPTIGSVYMGILLQKLGMAIKTRVANGYGDEKHETRATMEMKDRKVARTEIRGSGRPHDYWHEEKALNVITTRLQSRNLHDGFFRCETTEELHKFIREM